MATTVEARAREQVRAATPQAPWYRDRTRLGLAAGVAVLVVGLLAWFIVTSGRRKEEFAQRSLNAARTAAEAGNIPLASSELQKVIQTYKGTDAATEATLTLNQVRMVNGQSELAVVGLRDFLATKPEQKYLAPANGLLGSALENSKHFAEAGAAYQKASETATLEYLKARYLIDAGRAYRTAGKNAEAIAAYRAVLEKYPKSSSFTEAQVRLAEMTDGKL
ncbi:MAG: tol-pal system YbgF family protein [Gemmatimonadales bacterium]